jgi:DegV family protein with EDD domain
MEKSVRRRIAIVTDSTADIPARLLKEYDIHVIPQILIMGDKTWLDGVDIDPPAFYELLRSSPDCPSTSQPSIASFQELFRKLSREAEGVVAVLISDDLSGTLNSAQAAAASLPDVPVELVDTCGASMARAADAGEGLETVAAAARALVDRVQVYFVVDTLEYLHRGGRIGAAAKLLGSALDLKPVLEIRDGIVKPLARVRTRRKALRKVFDLLDEQLAGKDRIHMAVLHVAAPHEAAHLKEQFISCFHPVEMIETECGPVVGAHAGPGTVGVVFYAEDS